MDYRRLGPFRIIGKINDVTFRLDLPPQLRIHPVFHSNSLLEPYQGNTIPNCITPPPPPTELEDGPEYEVAAILDSKIVRNKLYYLVNWLGYSPSKRTWEPVENVVNARALIEDFHQQYPCSIFQPFSLLDLQENAEPPILPVIVIFQQTICSSR